MTLPPLPPCPARPLLLLDYDGTLAPIVPDPARAVPHPAVPALLARLADRHPTVVITGRDLATLGRLLAVDGVPVGVRAVGLHGAEWGQPGRPDLSRPHPAVDAEAVARLRATVPAFEGVYVEPKGALFAVHSRRAADPAAAEAALAAWPAAVPDGLDVVRGSCVVELRPAGVSKGVAVARLSAEHPGCTPVYVGDDTTDEDAFRALAHHADAVTVKVGDGPTAARHRLPGVDAVVAWLGRFAHA